MKAIVSVLQPWIHQAVIFFRHRAYIFSVISLIQKMDHPTVFISSATRKALILNLSPPVFFFFFFYHNRFIIHLEFCKYLKWWRIWAALQSCIARDIWKSSAEMDERRYKVQRKYVSRLLRKSLSSHYPPLLRLLCVMLSMICWDLVIVEYVGIFDRLLSVMFIMCLSLTTALDLKMFLYPFWWI